MLGSLNTFFRSVGTWITFAAAILGIIVTHARRDHSCSNDGSGISRPRGDHDVSQPAVDSSSVR